MKNNNLTKWLYFLFTISLLTLSLIEGKGFSGGRGSGGFKGGSSKGSGSFGGPASQNRVNSYGNSMGKPRSGSNFKSTAVSFAAGAAGGIAAYSLMRSMSGSYRSRPGYYEPGYGGGETCLNNENLNGTTFGQFRCPLNGFPYEAKYCCGDRGHQFCCIREGSGFARGGARHFGWIVLVIIILLIVILLWARRSRRRQREMMMIPTEPPEDKQYQPAPFYQPPPPAAGYPPPPDGNPYAVPPQNYNPYAQQPYMPYPPQQQQQQQSYMPYPPQQQQQQQQQYNPY